MSDTAPNPTAALDSRRIVGLLADETRRRVIAALVLAGRPLTAREIADHAGLDLRATVDGLDRLGDLLRVDDGAYVLDDGVFAEAARAEATPPARSAFEDQPTDIARVLDTAFRDGRLVRLPTKRAKRLVVLDHLAQRFEIGRRYPEREVNERLGEVHDDVAMLRRWLVDEQFLDRGNGMYWRCGGTV